MALMLADERLGDFRAIGDFGFVGPVPRLSRASSFVARLDAGHTVALDDPIAARPVRRRGSGVLARPGIYYFVPCIFEGAAIAVLALGRKDTDEPFNSEDLGAAHRGRRTGGDGDRERPPVPPAAPQGRGARPDARVQREHPRVARRRPGGVRRRTSGSSAGTARSSLLRRAAGRCHRPAARRDLRRAVRRRAAGRAPGESARRDALQGAAASAAGGRRLRPGVARGCWSTPPRCRCRTRRAGRRRRARSC